MPPRGQDAISSKGLTNDMTGFSIELILLSISDLKHAVLQGLVHMAATLTQELTDLDTKLSADIATLTTAVNDAVAAFAGMNAGDRITDAQLDPLRAAATALETANATLGTLPKPAAPAAPAAPATPAPDPAAPATP